MPDTPDSHPARPKVSIATRLRKIGFAAAVLLVFWLIFGQGVSRLILGNHASPAPSMQGAPEDTTEVAALKARVEQLEAKIKALEDVVAASSKTAGGDSAAPDRITALEAKVDALSQHSGDLNYDESRAAALEKNLKNQDDTVQSMKQQLNDIQARGSQQAAAMAAFAPLKDDIGRGDPFAASLNNLSQLSQGNTKAQALIDQLRPFADKGAITLPALKTQFDATIDKALAPSSGGLLKNLQSLVRIRKVGKEQQGTDDESIVARAEAKLDKGDVEAASKELGALSPPGMTAFSAWNASAQQWVHVKGALDALPAALAGTDAAAPAVVSPLPPAAAVTPPPAPAPKPVSQAAPAPAELAPSAGTPAPAVTPIPAKAPILAPAAAPETPAPAQNQ